MNVAVARFPRVLEAAYDPETIRRVLMARTAKLWAGGDLDVPVIALSGPLINVLRSGMARGRVRSGLEEVSDRLKKESAGIAKIRERAETPHGERVSRLVLCSNDGAERFYRHVEHLLQAHAPRVLACLLDVDGHALGKLMTGRERQIKMVMVEHKDSVSEALRAIIEGTI